VQKVLYAIGAGIALFVIVGLALPHESRVEVRTDIDARPATVFALINDFRRVNLWAPVTAADPNARVVYSGPPRGEGATVTWDGSIIGTGSELIVASQPFERIETIINAGSEGESRSTFTLSGRDGQTMLVWTFATDYGYNLVGRYLAVLLEDAVRQDHEQGLASLRELAESLPRADFSELQIEHVVVEAQTIAYLPTTSIPEPSAISEAMGNAYFRVLSFIDSQGLYEAGAPISITRSFSGGELLFDAAIPVRGVSDATPSGDDGVRIGETYAGPVIRVKHVGSYRGLGATHARIAAYLAALGIQRAGAAWESYVSDPTRVAESELLTYVYYPIEPAR
jgi:effector-binding domain-containing protein